VPPAFRGLKAPAPSGGVNAFSRYENGKTKPPLALVKLLKVLDRHPDLLDEIKVA
jgi:HTH-type transcriptional regulator/antitoxin MqsA